VTLDGYLCHRGLRSLKQLKKRLTKLRVKMSKTNRKALERESECLDRERLRKLAAEAGEILQKIPAKELIKSIRENREQR